MLENLNRTNLMKKIKQNISNIIIILFILLGIYSLFFGIFTIKNNYDWSIKIIFFSSSIIFFFYFYFFSVKKIKRYFCNYINNYLFCFFICKFLFRNLNSRQTCRYKCPSKKRKQIF